jgi:hypothetical protein
LKLPFLVNCLKNLFNKSVRVSAQTRSAQTEPIYLDPLAAQTVIIARSRA